MRSEAGFTLAEALIGLAVGSIAVSAAGLGVTAALNARAANLEASRMVEDLSAGVSLQRRLIAQAVPLRQPASEDGMEGYRFEGDASSMHFVAALWGDPGAAGLWEVSLSLTPQDQRSALLLTGHAFTEPKPGEQPAEPPPESVLAEAEAGAAASFAYASRNDEGALQWVSAWAPEDGWPALVSFDPDGEGEAPAAVVALPIVIEQQAQPATPEEAAQAAENIRQRVLQQRQLAPGPFQGPDGAGLRPVLPGPTP